MEREVLRTEGGVNSFILHSPLRDGNTKNLQQWLVQLQVANPFLLNPFVVNDSAGIASTLITKDWSESKRKISIRNSAAEAKFESAESLEFGKQGLSDAIELYRQALRLTSIVSDRVTILSRIGRCEFKLGRYKEGIDEYKRVLAYDGKDRFIGPLPASFVGLSQIADGYHELGDSLDYRTTILKSYDFLLHHPWDIGAGEYPYYLKTVGEIASRFENVKKDFELSQQEAAIVSQIRAINVFIEKVLSKVTLDSELSAQTELQPQHIFAHSNNESLQFGFMRLPGSVNEQRFTGLAYQFRPDFVTNQLLANVLKSADLEPNVIVAFLNEHDSLLSVPQGIKLSSQLASDNFSEVFPDWKVVLFDRHGQSIEELAGSERKLYLSLFVGIIVVMSIGIVVTVRAAAHEAELSKLKTDFVSNVSHELKTPLALIRMFGETLESGLVTKEEQRKEFYGIIRRESERLTHLIDNVLDFSKIDAGNKEYQIEETDLVEVVRSTLDAYKFHIRDQGFKVESYLPVEPVEVLIDKDAISQALLNLLSNATKYSANRKYIRVDVTSDGSNALISVEDRGVGIPQDLQTKIFEKFYRVPKEKSLETRGAGLGLTLTKHIIEAHRGMIECKSDAGKGSIFTMRIPVEQGATQ